jgi:NSS family neurotransmitter:Na+ symporter
MHSVDKKQYRESWGSRIGFILAAAGWSVGLGNIWRFPYITGKYGGGAFLLVYLISLFIIAIPLFTIEFSLGRVSQSSITTGFKRLAPKRPWFITGWIGISANVLISSYYMMIIGWVIAYFFKTITGQYRGMSADQINGLFHKFTSSSGKVILWNIVVYVILGIIVSRGLVKGVEAFCKVAMPLLFLLLIGLGIYALTLPGALKGAEFYLKPDFTKLNGEAIIAAIGQVFLSIGVGQGGTWVYGSYLSKKANIPADSIKVALMDTMGAILAGLIIFPAAFAFGVNPDAGFKLIFVTLPNVFGRMPGGVVFGTFFFFLVAFAAITSAIAHAECISSWLMDELKWDRTKSRTKAILITLSGIFLIGLPSILSLGPMNKAKFFGLSFFSFIDYITANIFLILVGLLMAIYVGWSLKMKKFMETTNVGARKIRVMPFWGIFIKYIIPLIILALFFRKIL